MNAIYLTTSKMAAAIGRSKDYLQQRKDIVFKEGVHYFLPDGKGGVPFWKVEAILRWVEGSEEYENQLVNNILSKVV